MHLRNYLQTSKDFFRSAEYRSLLVKLKCMRWMLSTSFSFIAVGHMCLWMQAFYARRLPCPLLWWKRHYVPLTSTECCMWVWLWHVWFIWRIGDLRYSQRSCQFKSSRMLRRVDCYLLSWHPRILESALVVFATWYIFHEMQRKGFLTSGPKPVTVSVLEQSFCLH